MQYIELKEQISKGSDFKKIINFKYVSFVSQRTMINNIKNLCLVKSNELLKVDYAMRHLFELLNVLGSYTNIEFEGLYDENNDINSELAIEIYDYCKENEIYAYVLNKNNDCKELLSILDDEIEQEIKVNNCMANVLNKVLTKIIDKIPSQEGLGQMMSEIPSVLSSLNLNTVKPSTKKRNLKKE